MKYKKIMLLTIMLTCLLAVSAASASDVNDALVTSEDTGQIDLSAGNEMDANNLKTSEDNTTLTQTMNDESVDEGIDSEIISANPWTYSVLATEINKGGNIELAHDYYIYDAGSTITITGDDRVIDGKGAVIDMDRSTNMRAFYVSASGVIIKNLVIKNARYNGDGGAIYFSSSGTVMNCNFIDNTGMRNGGAVCFSSTGNVINCNFINNTETRDSGELIGNGGAVYLKEGTVSNCNFTNSKASHGGAVYFYIAGNVTNCNFINSTASNRGGAVYFYSYDDGSTLRTASGSVTNCNFTNNSATYDGGAVSLDYGNCTVTNCNFINNKATGDSSGGAVHLGEATVSNCNFTGNTAVWGSAVHLGAGTVLNCNFPGNTATGGGAVHFSSTGNVTNCSFTNNTARNNGGAVILGEGTVSNCSFTNNTAWNNGGAVFFYRNGDVTNCNFTGNTVNITGGAVYFRNSGEVTYCSFTDNKATGDDSEGGAVYFYVNGNGEVRYCNFTNNTARNNGGAVHFLNTGEVTDCSFTNNSAGNNGGAVCFNSGNYGEVRYCSFTNNTAWNNGGAVFFYRDGDVTNCDFMGNNASAGSAVYFYKYNTGYAFTISNSIFLNNRANANDNTPFNVNKDGNNIIITFMGQNNLINAIYIRDTEVTFTNVTYWGATGITNTGNYSIKSSRSNKEAGQNITIRGVISGKIIETTKITNEKGTVVIEDAGDYWIIVSHKEDSYYTEVGETIFANMNLYANVTSKTTANKTVNITAECNIYGEVMPGKLLFILPNGLEINATYASNGTWWAEHTFDDYADYQVNASYVGLDNVTINNATIHIVRANSTVNVSDVALTYGESKEVTVTTTGATGITAKIDNDPVSVIDNYTIPISGLNVGSYTLTVTTIPDDDHNTTTKKVNITVNKADTEITITNETLYLKAGDVVSDIANLTPADAGNLTFQSSNEDIAIADDGTIYARVKGNVTVTVSFAGNDNYAPAENKTITVYITPKDASVSVENATLDLNVDETYEFNPTVNPRFLTVYYSSSNESVATVTDYGLLRAVGEGTAIITLTVGNDQTYAINTTNVTVKVSKIPTEIVSSAVSTVYNTGNDLIVTLNGADGKPISGANITVDLNGAKTYATDENGQVKVSTNGLAPKTYTAKITFNGNDKYKQSTNDVKVTVKKATPKITAKAKTFKKSVKTKKYTVTLKTNLNKVIKNTKVTIKVNKKTYSAKTNSKGVATFKITKLTKKGKYTATVTYNGNAYYNKLTKKVKITVK